jgi:acyl phosphate:glycerol-3-phosphate acyltransferase
MADPFVVGKAVIVIAGNYLLGCIATGYYLVRWRTGQDLRRLGSGSTGGTNAGRVLGRRGLAFTGLIDILKGAVAVAAANFFQLPPLAVAVCVAAVVAGHVFPIQLNFHGGRGLGPALGALLVYDTALVVMMLGLTGVLWLLSRRMTLSLMLCVAATPLFVLLLRRPLAEVWGLVPTALIILLAHRQKIAAEVDRLRSHPRATRH